MKRFTCFRRFILKKKVKGVKNRNEKRYIV